MRNIFKRKYRVYEVKKADDTSKFYPQSRMWCWFWKELSKNGSIAVYRNLDSANNFIYDLLKKDRRGKIVSTETHEFNELFHKLKESNRNHGTSDDSDAGFSTF